MNSSEAEISYLATANMQGGSKVYAMSSTFSMVPSSVAHTGISESTEISNEHLSYGIDFLESELIKEENKDRIKFTMASCSFYENTVYTWSAELNY
jgi:hypothetical protein